MLLQVEPDGKVEDHQVAGLPPQGIHGRVQPVNQPVAKIPARTACVRASLGCLTSQKGCKSGVMVCVTSPGSVGWSRSTGAALQLPEQTCKLT